MIATQIRDLWQGNISEFVANVKRVILLFDDVIYLLNRHERLSEAEKQILYWFAIDREGVDMAELPKNILPIWQRQVWEGLTFLHWRSLIETSKDSAIFTIQPVVMEYITERLRLTN